MLTYEKLFTVKKKIYLVKEFMRGKFKERDHLEEQCVG